ncbi:MAG: putative Na+/H+ antiporter [Deltaproteobacteria bacterium]|nr:putative Na+/H+ antiporter [Deltaproteobacteria bacterium]
MQPDTTQIMATALFAAAILHTFLVKRFEHWARQFRAGSIAENLLHILAQVEVVFGVWAAVFLLGLAMASGPQASVDYLNGRDFTEAAFVFVILVVCATRPVLHAANTLLKAVSGAVARALRVSPNVSFYAVALTLGPLLGSFITEPAAMTVTALVLKRRFFDREVSAKFKYATLGILFVNVSIGGVLTPYAAPPVLMVAAKWGWGLSHMAAHFGWKAAVATLINAAIATVLLVRELAELGHVHAVDSDSERRAVAIHRMPWWLVLGHITLLAGIVATAHHMTVFIGLFLLFLGVVRVTAEYQERIELQEGLLVGFFLSGLVVLGGMQRWWLEPLLQSLTDFRLFLGATALTAITDNAALTYLGAQVADLSESLKYALVAGAVAGGGLTVIANAPNPAGYGILRESFGEEGISPMGLFLAALGPTLIAMACLWFLP